MIEKIKGKIDSKKERIIDVETGIKAIKTGKTCLPTSPYIDNLLENAVMAKNSIISDDYVVFRIIHDGKKVFKIDTFANAFVCLENLLSSLDEEIVRINIEIANAFAAYKERATLNNHLSEKDFSKANLRALVHKRARNNDRRKQIYEEQCFYAGEMLRLSHRANARIKKKTVKNLHKIRGYYNAACEYDYELPRCSFDVGMCEALCGEALHGDFCGIEADIKDYHSRITEAMKNSDNEKGPDISGIFSFSVKAADDSGNGSAYAPVNNGTPGETTPPKETAPDIPEEIAPPEDEDSPEVAPPEDDESPEEIAPPKDDFSEEVAAPHEEIAPPDSTGESSEDHSNDIGDDYRPDYTVKNTNPDPDYDPDPKPDHDPDSDPDPDDPDPDDPDPDYDDYYYSEGEAA